MENKFMQMAIDLAHKCIGEIAGGPFGAVIVKNNHVVGKGSNQVTSHNDPTGHAEITAIRNACHNLETFSLDGCEIYTSCEPCPMCLGAILWARIDKVYYAANRSDAAKIGFDDHLFYEEICKPLHERSLPMIEMDREAAIEAFNAWDHKEDKVEY